jgi:hypothetical protein
VGIDKKWTIFWLKIATNYDNRRGGKSREKQSSQLK